MFMRLFAQYNERYLLPRYLHGAAVRGAMYDGGRGRPALFIMNHCSWWDGMLVFLAITRLSGYEREHYVMMDEKQLKKFRFFRRLGAFSVDKSSQRGILQSLRYAEEKLKAGHNVWLFPQGDIRHLEARPLQFQSGTGY
ncbi:lysophospholipid acyltransferase family protein, partial [Mycobacterium tuberculosis]